MSYVLINGKRYYKDDRTGETTRANVSQAVADRRAQKTQQMAGRSSAQQSTATVQRMPELDGKLLLSAL